jgi:hypothetical protein
MRAQRVKRIVNRDFIGTMMLMGSMSPCCSKLLSSAHEAIRSLSRRPTKSGDMRVASTQMISCSSMLYFRQGTMYKMDRDRTFANG